MTYTRQLTTLLVCVLATACSSDMTGTLKPSAQALQLPVAPDEASADLVARGFAAAMADPANRLSVRDAMRASPFTEHKLLLQEFLRTPAGVALVAAAASKLGVGAEAFSTAVAALPAIDFYVPAQIQRKTWTGGSSIRVGYVLAGNAQTSRAYDPAGVPTPFLDGITTAGSATLVLQAAEFKARRIGPQAATPGSVIQDANDGNIGGEIVEYLRDGTKRVTELADVYTAVPQSSAPNLISGSKTFSLAPRLTIAPCEPACGGGGTTRPPDTTFIDNVVVIEVCDNMDCWEGNEFEWHTYYRPNSAAGWGYRTDLRMTGIASTEELSWYIPVIFKKPKEYYGSEAITSDVVETDGWGDDHFEPSPIWVLADNGVWKFEGDSRCGRTRASGQGIYDCYDYPYFPWKEVNQNFGWHQ